MANSAQITGKLTFLGTGTSTGVPLIGCDCEVCHSADPRDHRLRCSSLIETQGRRILIDCGPDFRQQALCHDIRHLDAVLVTHNHFDHLYGLDDVRPMGNMPVYGDKVVLDTIHAFMPYCFGEHKYPGSATVELHEVRALESFTVAGIEVMPIPVTHGRFAILGYRFGSLAYITDASFLSEEAFAALQGVKTLVLNALRNPHFLPACIWLTTTYRLYGKTTLGSWFFALGFLRPQRATDVHASTGSSACGSKTPCRRS